MAEQRIQKVLADQGSCSRREAERLIAAGKVKVNGHPVTLGDKMDPDFDKVSIDGKSVRIVRKRQYTYLMLNKPRGYITTASDERGRKTVMDLLTGVDRRVYPIGRLDKGSQGLLLMANQGGLVNKIMRCGNGHEKEYEVTIDRPVTEEFLKKMASGLWLAELERKTLPCKVRKTGDKSFSIILTQGLNRQIRRMCEACGCHVRTLKRVRIMNIHLGNLKEGSFREITGEEYRTLLAQLEQSKSLSERDLRLKNK